ncbi:MAG: glucoamylase family protein, partial [Candidatus Binatia bacterium]
MVQLTHRLREQGPSVLPAIRWLDEHLAVEGKSADELVQLELHSHGTANLLVRNVITSMRLLSALDWKTFFENVSLVDEALRAESNFGEMDFRTRDMYRHAIEELARGSRRSELEVARAALGRARKPGHVDGGPDAVDERARDPGYYLVSEGRPALEREIRFRASSRQRMSRAYVASANPGYVVTVLLLTAVILAPFLLQAGGAGAGALTLLLLELVLFFPASDLAIAIMNRAVTELIGPRRLPKLELHDGVPADLRTMVVIPALLTSQAEIQELIDRLEVHHLANSDGEIHFAILSDWLDAPSEQASRDEELLAAAISGIQRLNDIHGALPGGESRFFLFHRRRLWNEGERRWMGWERKRGKLRELNRLLRGAPDTTFLAVGGESARAPEHVRYVITLDSDTRLPPRAAIQLVSAMAHPLNRPRFDPATGSVIEGYGLLQPRITPSLPTAGGESLFQRIFSGPAGIDPYAAAVSDVYQDLFHEGSYTGKGIYDVDAFEVSLAGRVPDNTLLSHDLFEGLFARAGLASDVELFEEFPRHYEIAAAREHRWARGDWQLLPWILGYAPHAGGGLKRTPSALIGEWKLADNLRRTLSAPATVLALLVAWTLPVADPVIWTAFVLATIAIPALLPTFLGIIPRRRRISKRTHARAVTTDFFTALVRVTLGGAFLAHQACLMTDAIVRTIVRLYVTRRHLLEWVTAAPARSGPGASSGRFLVRVESSLVVAAGAAVVVALANPEAWPVAAPFIVVWAFSPAIVRAVSEPLRSARAKPLATADRRALRRIARRTWRFFETFVGPDDHALPPDNFQEEPKGEVARRTSPTNLGMYLLSTVVARDFGWLGTLDFVDRLEATLETMKGLERFRGHFYNWYDTRELRPLEPRYVSSVDSGNLAGHLIALANACRDVIDRPVLDSERFAGIEDALLELKESASALADRQSTGVVTRKHLEEALESFAAGLISVPDRPSAFAESLAILSDRMETVLDIARPLVDEEEADDREVLAWGEAMASCVASHIRDLEAMFPAALIRPIGRTASGSQDHTDDRAARDVIERVFVTVPTLTQLPDRCEAAIAELAATSAAAAAELQRVATASASLARRLSRLGDLARELFAEMDFRFLFDPTRQLFAIGYRTSDTRLDSDCYDLLASEACLASFIGIAKGDVPASHWFRLGRALTPVDRGSALVSWSGSMFEYLMPALVMDPPPGSLFDQTYGFVVRRQVRYGRERGVPWGVSESAYNALDLERTYQYSSFGVPGLGLKRGLSVDVVVAPYATGLATMVDAAEAVRNFARLAADGGSGRYGFYEALDYTPARVPEGQRAVVVRAYMAHHQGMLLVALGNVLTGGRMRARFRDEPMMRATELLLQERMPRDVAVARPR